eukprot:TRINITY_DN8746_c0_g2_i3.p1 TRINITY_DN8746_c0_g2~~TRINITY_DN8746_c0_g2_i3.p1  ORF type:complete len:414 (+),score=30.60 TRINITY_DN8746_c0_g2_i3:59-1243(+)
MFIKEPLPRFSFAAGADKRTSTYESVLPLLNASLKFECPREDSFSVSSSAQGGTNPTRAQLWRSSTSLCREEGPSSHASNASSGCMLKNSIFIQPPSFPEPAKRRPRVRTRLFENADVAYPHQTERTCSPLDTDSKTRVANFPLLAWVEDAANVDPTTWTSANDRNGDHEPNVKPRSPGAHARLEAERCEQSSINSVDSDGLRKVDVDDVGFVAGSAPCRSNSERAPIDSHPIIMQAEQQDVLKTVGGARVVVSNVSISRRAPLSVPPISEMGVMSKHDVKGAAMKYNLVQFQATPTLSTSCDRNKQDSAPRESRTRSKESSEAPPSKKTCDRQQEPEDILGMFHGWSRREVKEMLRGTYSSDEISEVLQALKESEPRRSKRSRSKQSSSVARD